MTNNDYLNTILDSVQTYLTEAEDKSHAIGNSLSVHHTALVYILDCLLIPDEEKIAILKKMHNGTINEIIKKSHKEKAH